MLCLFIVYMLQHKQPILQETADGSHTLYLPEIDETYHSTHGAINESLHVFLRAGFDFCVKPEISVLEVGFGTGLNAYLTAIESKNRTLVRYCSIEKFPLQESDWLQLNFAKEYGGNEGLLHSIQRAPWGVEVNLSSTFNLQKIEADFTCLSLSEKFDLIYYDAFSPDKQPELWTEQIFQTLYAHTNQGGVLTTYCAKGAVRRAMQQAGYLVERMPGPKGKREMLRAVKP